MCEYRFESVVILGLNPGIHEVVKGYVFLHYLTFSSWTPAFAGVTVYGFCPRRLVTFGRPLIGQDYSQENLTSRLLSLSPHPS